MTTAPVEVEELLKRLKKPADAEERPEVEFYLEAATEAAEEWKNTGPIVVRSVTEQVWATDRGSLIVSKTPVVSVTTATYATDGTVYVTADLSVDSLAGIIRGENWRLPRGEYTVVYSAGRAVPAAKFKMAVLLIAEHNWRAKQGPRTRTFRGPGTTTDEEMRAPNGFLIPRIAAGYLRGDSEPFAMG